MCLLDRVIAWDNEAILCLTNTHRDRQNPLRRSGRLSIVHAFEYGGQAAAVHGGLCARAVGTTAPPGYLAAIRDAHLHATYLDELGSPLEIRARRLFGENVNCVYEVRLLADNTLLADGRVTIVERT